VAKKSWKPLPPHHRIAKMVAMLGVALRTRVLLGGWLCAAAALAPALGAAAPGRQTVVLIAQEAADPMTERALDAIVAGLVDVPIEVVTQRVAGWDSAIANRVDQARGVAATTGAIAVIWLDLSAPRHVFLFIADSTGGRVLVRNVASEEQDVEAQLETLAVIVRGSIDGLLAGGRIGVERPVAAPPRKDDAERIGATIGYALQLFAPTAPVIHGARLALSIRLARRLHLLAGYRLDIPVEVESPEVAADIWSHPIELGAFSRFEPARWRIDLGAGAVVDVVTFDVTSRSSDVAARNPAPRATVALAPFVRAARTVGRHAALFFAVGIEIELYNHRYVVTTTEDSRVVVAPWRVRPIFELGASFTLL
jgi:hypothetical protein